MADTKIRHEQIKSGDADDGDVLTADGSGGSNWEAPSGGTIANHDHSGDAGDGGTFDAANLTSGASDDGQVLTSDGSGGAAWEDVPPGGSIALDDLTDVNAPAPNDGDVLTWDDYAGEWVAAEPAAGGGDVATDPIWDAKGDLAVGTGANTASKLSVGSNGLFLKADSGETTGLIWDSPGVSNDGWISAAGTWTPRSQAFTNDPAAGSNIELEMVDTSGFYVGDIVNVSSSSGNEDALISVVHANIHLTVSTLTLDHTTTNPLVRLSNRLPYSNAYTNDPAAGSNIELNMTDTSGFAVGMLVQVSSSAGVETATITVVDTNVHITVNTLALNHTTTNPIVRVMVNSTFVVDTSGDLSGSIGIGDRIKFTDGTIKYFIVTEISSTRLTLYGGTDYSIAGASVVTSPYYSHMKSPFGFPINPIKWTVEVTDINDLAQNTPVNGTWYNLGPIYISIPIGCWRIYYSAHVAPFDATDADYWTSITLSTANNAESDYDFTIASVVSIRKYYYLSRTIEKYLALTGKTIYYLLEKVSNNSLDSLRLNGSSSKTTIRAICAYL